MEVEGLIILTKLATVKARKLVGISRGKRGEGGGESNWRWTDVTSRCTTEYTLAAWELIWILLYIYLDAFDFDNFPFSRAVRTCHKCLAKSCQIHNFGYNLYNT